MGGIANYLILLFYLITYLAIKSLVSIDYTRIVRGLLITTLCVLYLLSIDDLFNLSSILDNKS